MSEASKICAVAIKRLWHTSADSITTDLTAIGLKNILSTTNSSNCKEIKNIHQNTWTLEESEPSQDSYRNQLTGAIYRMGSKTMGEIKANFTIGQYDYRTKAEFMGGTATDTSWKRARGIVDIFKTLIILTEDDQYCVLPYAHISAREANTDNAVGLAITGTAMEPLTEAVSSEYWFDKAEVDEAA